MTLWWYSLNLNLLKPVSLYPRPLLYRISPILSYSVGFWGCIAKSSTDLFKFHHVALDSSLKSLEITWYLSSRIFMVSLHLGASVRLDRPPFLHLSPLETSIHWLAFFGFKFSLLHLVRQNIGDRLPRAQIYEVRIWGCRYSLERGRIYQSQ